MTQAYLSDFLFYRNMRPAFAEPLVFLVLPDAFFSNLKEKASINGRNSI